MEAIFAVIWFFIFAPGILLVVAFVLEVMAARDRAERIEEAMQYDPEPLRDGRFATPDELRKRGW
jgi:hypothetical protein